MYFFPSHYTTQATPNHTSYVVLFKYNGSSQLALPPSLRKLLQPNTPPTPKQDVKAENKANEGQVDQPSSEPVKVQENRDSVIQQVYDLYKLM